jgi:hypothetical protein
MRLLQAFEAWISCIPLQVARVIGKNPDKNAVATWLPPDFKPPFGGLIVADVMGYSLRHWLHSSMISNDGRFILLTSSSYVYFRAVTFHFQ